MESYTGFASVYDELMDNVPYDDWAVYVTGLLREYGVSEGIVCELGCGTGNITRRLRDAGYDMIGIDLSAEMLEIAREKEESGMVCGSEEPETADTPESGTFDDEEIFEIDAESEADMESDAASHGILYLEQDMREFELYGTVAAVVSICDSMNYITENKDLLQVFRLVNNYLDPDGVFVFDLNTEYKFRELLGDTTIAENRENVSLIWENAYDPETKLHEYDITIYKKAEIAYEEEDEELPELYERFYEEHVERAYTLDEVKELLKEAGLIFVAAYDAGTHEPVRADSERMYIVAKEGYQERKYYQPAKG